MPSISQDEISKYWEIFQQHNPSNGYLSSSQMMGILQNSQLPSSQLAKVWDLADIDGDGSMDFEEFCIAMRLVFDNLKSPGEPIPSELPQWLIPGSKQHLLEAKLALAGKPTSVGPGSPSLMDDEDLTLRQDFNWYINPSERKEYEAIYSVNCDSRGRLSFDSLRELYSTLNRVPSTDVSSAWNLVNPKSEERIDKEQCIVFLHILSQRDKGVRLPRSVPASLRAAFGRETLDYDLGGSQAQIKRASDSSPQKSSFAEGYLSRLGLGGRSQGFKSSGTDFSATKDTDWEEARLKRELQDLEDRLNKIEAAKQRKSSGASSNSALVRRELQLLLEYKESQLKERSNSTGSSNGDLNAAREEVDMVAEQLEALKEHYRSRQEQLASLEQELRAL